MLYKSTKHVIGCVILDKIFTKIFITIRSGINYLKVFYVSRYQGCYSLEGNPLLRIIGKWHGIFSCIFIYIYSRINIFFHLFVLFIHWRYKDGWVYSVFLPGHYPISRSESNFGSIQISAVETNHGSLYRYYTVTNMRMRW